MRKSPAPRPPRKASGETQLCPYRKPTPVGRGNAPKVNERTSVKELGKLTPYLWKKGCLSSFGGCDARWGEEVAGNWLKRLFTKNTGLCQRASGRIGADSCPVPEGKTERCAKLRREAPVNGGRNYNGPKVAKFLVG